MESHLHYRLEASNRVADLRVLSYGNYQDDTQFSRHERAVSSKLSLKRLSKNKKFLSLYPCDLFMYLQAAPSLGQKLLIFESQTYFAICINCSLRMRRAKWFNCLTRS